MSYFKDRMKLLKVTPEENKIKLKFEGMAGVYEYEDKIFTTDEEKDNIKILVYDLDRFPITYEGKLNQTHRFCDNRPIETYRLIRNNPDAVANGMPRYVMPKGAGIYPFIPKELLEKYEQKKRVETLILTEGYIKAFYASKRGFNIIGFSSITHFADSKTKTIHKDVARIITELQVKNVVMLYDGDCLNISTKDIEEKEDLARRPQTFLNSMLRVRELLTDFEVNIYFAHVLSDNIKNSPKGLDDLLIQEDGNEEAILNDLTKLATPGQYFYKMNVSIYAKKLQPYFNLKSVEQFYGAWGDLIGSREFVYFGSTYKVNDEGKLERTVPKELKAFIRVGDDYFENIKMPSIITGELEEKLVPRKKGTISDDFGKDAFQKIPKYKAFINRPSHTNYQRIVANCYNIYNPFEYEPEQGEWNTIEDFLRHIFGEQYELGLDYLQIIYQYPTQPLPILCLVSKERKTGKTTFADFMKDLYKENAIKIGSQEFQSQFNAFLTTKLIVCVDETSLEKNRDITERIKMLSTTNKVISEGKGQNQIEVDHFAKYILCSNFETNFIYTQEEETRFWVRKVPTLEKEIPNLLLQMHEEIPAFLYFLNKRKISVPHKTRTWFDEELLKTDALQRLKEEQRPRPIKLIETFIKEMVEDFKIKEVIINETQLCERVAGLKKYENQIRQVIMQHMKADVTRASNGNPSPVRYSLPRYQYTLDASMSDVVWEKFRGRAFVFKAEDYLSEEELKMIFPKEPEQGVLNFEEKQE